MPTLKPKLHYNASQAELYAICGIGWDSFEENLADFTAFKTFYDAAFLATRRAEIDAAKVLPDDQARGAASETFRIQMQTAADAAALKWKALSAYIKSAFPGDIAKPQLEAAGKDYYTTALNGDWEDLELMLTAGQTFITNNNAILTAPGGMPLGFPVDYDADFAAFSDLYTQFEDAQLDSVEGTDEKISANNDVYDALMSMFDDGQIIYDDIPAKRERFIFANVKALVTPPKGSGSGSGDDDGSTDPGTPTKTSIVKGKVTDMTMAMIIEGATVTFIFPDAETTSTITDMNGNYEMAFKDLVDGMEADVTIEGTAPGYMPSSTIVHIIAGTDYTVDLQLSPMP